MKARIEPNKLKSVLEAGTISGLIDPLEMIASKEGISMQNLYGGSLATNHIFDPSFFIKFNADGKDKEEVVVSSILDKFKLGFDDDEIDFITDDESFYLVGGRLSYDNKLEEASVKGIPDYLKKLSAIKNKKGTTVGYLPLSNKAKFNPNIMILLDSSELKLPTAKDFSFSMEGKVLEIRNSEQGNFKLKPKIDDVLMQKDGDTAIAGDFIRSIFSCLNGKVLLALDTKSDNLNLVVSEIGKGYRKLFCVSGIQSGEQENSKEDDESSRDEEESEKPE